MENETSNLDWYRKYRPTKFKDVLGQDEAVKTLIKLIKNNTLPHVMLMVGSSGVGKTTLARILKVKLNCDDIDFNEINAAEARGIDTVRSIQDQMVYAPIQGTSRIWLIDECFHKDTKVLTPQGNVSIGNLQEGHTIVNIEGRAKIKHVFKNKVDISRVVRLEFSDGTVLFTTKEHEFLTDEGWTKAENLYNFDACLFRKTHYFILNLNEGCQNENSKRVCLPLLRKNFLQSRNESQSSCPVLFQKLCSEFEEQEVGFWIDGREKMPLLRKTFFDKKITQKYILREVLSCQMEKLSTRIQRKSIQCRNSKKNKQCHQEILSNREWNEECSEDIKKNDCKQSCIESKCCGKGDENKGAERNASYLAGEARRQWSIHAATNCIARSVGGGKEWLGKRSPDSNRTSSIGWIWLSNLLQSGCRKQGFENRDRGRWERSSVEKEYIERCQENRTSNKVRVVNYEVYQQGYNDSSFLGIIGDQERKQGFVEFFDLEIDGHPSYFAEGLPVHNCHKLTGDAQTALLKTLEDTPSHVYFILATTDPQKLLPTIRTRCTEIKLVPLSTQALKETLQRVMTAENITISEKVINKLIETAEGSARKAIVDLQKISVLSSEDEQLAIIEKPDVAKAAFDIVKALLWEKTNWSEMAKILNKVEEEPEAIRRLVLANATKELLKGGRNSSWAASIVQNFRYNFFESGKAGLVEACWSMLERRK